MKILFNVHGNTIINYTNQIIELLYELSFESFQNHTNDRLNQQAIYFNKYEEPLILTSIVDGSEQRVGTSLDGETKINNFSAKKGYPSITKLVFCSPIGKIQFLSDSRPGSRNDQGMMYEVSEFLNKFDKF